MNIYFYVILTLFFYFQLFNIYGIEKEMYYPMTSVTLFYLVRVRSVTSYAV